MAKCPYTWVKSLFSRPSGDPNVASELRVTVTKGGETTVDVSLPAKSARWLIDVIPVEVINKIRSEGIPIDSIQDDLAKNPQLMPQDIFLLEESFRRVRVWLE